MWEFVRICYNLNFSFFQKNIPDASIQISADSLVMGQSNFIECYGFNGLHKIYDNEFLSIFGASMKENLQPYLHTLFTLHGRRRNEMSISTVCEYQQQFSCHIVKCFRQLVSAHLENRSAIFQYFFYLAKN